MVNLLKKIGFQHVRINSSHAILTKQTEQGKMTLPVPQHKKLAKGTLLSIMKQTKIEREDLLRLL